MLLTLTTTRSPATDLGWLLHTHPARVQVFDLALGKAHVFYPEATEQRCKAAPLLDVDPLGLVRRRGGPAGEGSSLQQYLNDTPYVASSFMSVAIAQVFGSALGGRCQARPDLVNSILPLEARIAVLPYRDGEAFLRSLLKPLGYTVDARRHPLDPEFPEWGDSNYFTITFGTRRRLCDLITQLYVLINVLDNDIRYWVSDDEVDKLLRRGAGWLAAHPDRESIARRYLKQKRVPAREALARLAEKDHPAPDAEQASHGHEEATLEAQVRVDPKAAILVHPPPAEDVPAAMPEATIRISRDDKDAESRPEAIRAAWTAGDVLRSRSGRARTPRRLRRKGASTATKTERRRTVFCRQGAV